ncbi:MAG: BspA family leucine-rich repeat surface protein, partial [Clostridia bacterium]|nr:BspA family leucine-rich repeat surface protein [Clostridia bacterium]
DKGFFDGKTVKLDADITIKKSAGSSGHGFTGTFDGQEYTLTVADNYSYAPFCYVDNGCVIEKLHTDGIVRAVVSGTSRTNASGLIDTLTGNVTVRNCCSSVMIHDSNTTRHEGKHGGLVGKTDSGSSVTIEGCIFDGKMATIIPDYTTDCAGFVGEANGSVNIKNSIYDPDTLLQQDGAAISDSGSATFVRGGSATMTNCYYTRTLGTAQGKQAHTITADENVTIDYGTATDIYSVITAYGTGLAYNDNFYAGEGDEVTLTLDNIPPTGYKLKNYTVDHGTLNGNILTMPNESVKAGAVFDPITYTVAFDKNHSDASGTMNAQHFTYNESRNLTENGFTAPKDYRFAGWATSPDGTAEYGNGAEVKNLTAADGTTVTLYAKWETPNYSILKNSTHGTITAKVGETENALTAHYNDTVILTVQPDAGYWLKKLIVMDADGNEVPVNDNKFTMPDGDVTVSAAFDNSDECAFDEETGTLYLRGNVDKSDVQQYKDKAVYVVAEEGTVLPEDCGAMFDTFKKVQSIDLKKADTSAVTNMSSMFSYCDKLANLDVSSFDTSAVTDMSSMFSGCSGLTDLDVSSFDTSAVTDMSNMFFSCSGLANLDVSRFDTTVVMDMDSMFSGCSGLTDLDVSSFDTSAVTDMSDMFNSCEKLANLDISSFDTSNVHIMTFMFANCSGLTTIYVSYNW